MKTRNSAPSLRRTLALALAIGAIGSFAVPREARAIPGGTIIITDHALDPKSSTFEKDLKKAQKASLPKQGDGWHLYFVAYLKKAAGAPEVNIVFYDLGEKDKHAEATAFPVATQPNAKILMSDVQLSPEQAFKSGGRYDVRITRLVNGKEDVYARSKIELK